MRRTRPEVGQVATFVAGHPSTNAQALESCTFRDSAEGASRCVVCLGTDGLHAPWGCDSHRTSTMEAKSMDHVKDFVSRLVHLSLSLRLDEHRKCLRGCMHTIVGSRLTLLHEWPITARTYWSCSGPGAARCWMTGSLVGVATALVETMVPSSITFHSVENAI